MKGLLIIMGIVMLSACGYKRVCHASVNQFGLLDQQKLKRYSSKILMHDLDTLTNVYQIEYANWLSGYEWKGINGRLITDLRRRYRPAINSKEYHYVLAYFIYYQGVYIERVNVPLNQNLNLDSSHIAFSDYQEKVNHLFEINEKGVFKRLNLMMNKVEANGFKRKHGNGLVNREGQTYLSFIRYSGEGFFNGDVLLINIFDLNDVSVISTDDFFGRH